MANAALACATVGLGYEPAKSPPAAPEGVPLPVVVVAAARHRVDVESYIRMHACDAARVIATEKLNRLAAVLPTFSRCSTILNEPTWISVRIRPSVPPARPVIFLEASLVRRTTTAPLNPVGL